MCVCDSPRDVPFSLPPTLKDWGLKEGEEVKLEAQKDVLAHRGSLSVSRRLSSLRLIFPESQIKKKHRQIQSFRVF